MSRKGSKQQSPQKPAKPKPNVAGDPVRDSAQRSDRNIPALKKKFKKLFLKHVGTLEEIPP
jgi:hypothetical protein